MCLRKKKYVNFYQAIFITSTGWHSSIEYLSDVLRQGLLNMHIDDANLSFMNIACKICKYYLFLYYNISDAFKIFIF